MVRRPLTTVSIALAAALALAGCHRDDGDKLAVLDNRLGANDADPAVTNAVNDPILTDRDLANQSNRNAIRAAAGPPSASYPPGSEKSGGTGCAGARLDSNPEWARRLEPPFAVYPGARLSEAAGEAAPCRLRFVGFTTGDPWQRVLAWYQGRAVEAGYSADRQTRDTDQILAGLRGDAAYYLVATPRDGGTEVSLLVNASG
jgi:hypothetical protein